MSIKLCWEAFDWVRAVGVWDGNWRFEFGGELAIVKTCFYAICENYMSVAMGKGKLEVEERRGGRIQT